MGTEWLKDALFYEIYPQSFADSDGDGVGDLRGVIDHLDHVASLGVGAIWFNPCFASPFVDAGYDVADYLTVAPRYGTNDDLVELVEKARERGIRVVLDLVAGHTSIEHAWFQRELAADGPSPEGDRYVWRTDEPREAWASDLPGTPAWVRSPGPRPGWYLKNFYDEQPALNFGWVTLPGDEPWRDAVDDPGPRRNRAALQEVIAFWLERGVSGFRVDMAFSLVKDLDQEAALAASTGVWREIRAWLDAEHPDAVIVPEGFEPRTTEPLAFHADFALVIMAAHASLFDNQGAGVLPFQEHQPPYFDAEGAGSTRTFLETWREARREHPDRPVLLSSADHDFSRLACGSRTAEQLGAALTFLLTWGTVPCLYYGDEIGMRYLPDMPDVEGAVCNPTYNRAGCRTPMQWDDGPHAGFSTAETDRLYLPVDPDPGRPTVAGQDGQPGSVLTLVRELAALRRAVPALRVGPSTRVVAEGYPFAWVRGGTHLVVVNPRREPARLVVPETRGAVVLWGDGVTVSADAADAADAAEHAGAGGLEVAGFGYAVLAVDPAALPAGERLAGWLEGLGIAGQLDEAGLPSLSHDLEGRAVWTDPNTGEPLDADQLDQLERLLRQQGDEPEHAVPVALVLLARQARLHEELLATPTHTYASLAELRGVELNAARFQVHKAAAAHRLLLVAPQGRTLVPAFQLTGAGEPRAELLPVLEPLLAAGTDPWRVWAWLTQPAALLGGAVPERAVTDPEEAELVRRAALSLARRST
ncbi:hypothetical protein G7072_09320 [Nocardioides sp. HDW12B]|uniref:alpha-amylase family glycosyl hydrolase n=1 Tax=Nocardioides sp. HDW12B TaxID=2714939 RepID=UPI00140E56E0|nr:alpha-amylase family glycosyl hydrolase [Nocardioides sp. HDW12B]QIK66524.1 hypothetical protein G7072_09320 [Nocardioides sp. HDW12B]